MLSLYFNCKLTEQKTTPGKPTEGYNYPVMYPKKIETALINQYEILIATIDSYSLLSFDNAIFNIDIDYIDERNKEELVNLINDSISANNIYINFTRPSTVDGWVENVRETSKKIKKNSPVLVVMNHDHPFIDYTEKIFERIILEIFKENTNNNGKALYYSHAPEVISWAVNGRHNLKFERNSDGIYKSDVMHNWIDSICIMTMETLENIWKRANYKGNYIGRFDWKDVSYTQLGIVFYTFPREFFKHFDGYGHITGIRLISEYDSQFTVKLKYPNNSIVNNLSNFYYQRWLDCFLLTIRDRLRRKDELIISNKKSFVNAIEETIELLKIGYIEADVSNGLLQEKQLDVVEAKIRSHIYHQGNMLYDSIKTDIELLETIEYKEKYELIKKYMPKLIINFIRRLKYSMKKSD